MKKVVIGIISILILIGIATAIYMYFNNSVNSESNNEAINISSEENKKQENIINEINNTDFKHFLIIKNFVSIQNA